MTTWLFYFWSWIIYGLYRNFWLTRFNTGQYLHYALPVGPLTFLTLFEIYLLRMKRRVTSNAIFTQLVTYISTMHEKQTYFCMTIIQTVVTNIGNELKKTVQYTKSVQSHFKSLLYLRWQMSKYIIVYTRLVQFGLVFLSFLTNKYNWKLLISRSG